MKSDAVQDFLAALTDTVHSLSTAKPLDGRLIAHRVPVRPWVRMAIGPDGLAALLPPVGSNGQAPLEFANLRVRFNASCTVESPEGVATESLVIVECTTEDEQMQIAFLRALAVVLPASEKVTGAELENAVRSLAELFLAIQSPARGTILGLWGELFLIAISRNPELAVDSWHPDPAERFDFGSGSTRIEVKTTSGPIRQHHFSLEQVRPPAGSTVFVASIITSALGGGTSVSALIERICARVNAERAARVNEVVLRTLGNSWSRGMIAAFDEQLALETLRGFDTAEVPCINQVPDGVTEVRFKSDLTSTKPLAATDIKDMNKLVEVLLGDACY